MHKNMAHQRFRQVRRVDERFRHFCLERYCPCCTAHFPSFTPYGARPRPEARCPICRSMERHRLIYLYIIQKTDLLDERPKKLLHIAPEEQMSRLFRRVSSIDYLSADLSSSRAMVKMDITRIGYPANSFDVIYCSHVLEHVTDDRKAMRELCRVLKPEGWAILQVPVLTKSTFEDPAATSPADRERLYGQRDHVRMYGRDYKDRLVESGFAVTVDEFARGLSGRTTRRLGLTRSTDVYLCRKRAGDHSSCESSR